LLDHASVLESYDSHSRYQIAVYTKVLVYLVFNTFVIPVLTIASGGKSLYELVSDSGFNFARILSELFMPKSAEFFIYLLIQQGVISVVFYSLNLSDIAWSYFIPEVALQRRYLFNDSEPWRRHE
jgi:hypothetical protein